MYKNEHFEHKVNPPTKTVVTLLCLALSFVSPQSPSDIRTGTTHEYALVNDGSNADQRLHLREQALDAATREHLVEFVQPGISCLELGPGRGSITHWLTEKIGAGGRVKAIDQRPLFTNQNPANLDLVTADILEYDFGQNQYHLIFARDVFEHLPTQKIQELLHRLQTALKPGGHILIEGTGSTDYDCLYQAFTPDVAKLLRKMAAKIKPYMDFGASSRLPSQFRIAGLSHIRAEQRQVLTSGNHPFNQMLALSFQQMKQQLIEQEEEPTFLKMIQQITDPEIQRWGQPKVWVSGQKPL